MVVRVPGVSPRAWVRRASAAASAPRPVSDEVAAAFRELLISSTYTEAECEQGTGSEASHVA